MSFTTTIFVDARQKHIGSKIEGQFNFGEFIGVNYTAHFFFETPRVTHFNFWTRRYGIHTGVDMISGTKYSDVSSIDIGKNLRDLPVDETELQTMLRMVGQIRCMILSSELDIEFLKPFVERLE